MGGEIGAGVAKRKNSTIAPTHTHTHDSSALKSTFDAYYLIINQKGLISLLGIFPVF